MPRTATSRYTGPLMDSPSRGRLDAGAPSPLAHPLPEPGVPRPVDAGPEQDAEILPSDAADPLRRGPLRPRPGDAGEGM
ncbi:hypothetical protein MN0502_21550 [Arthrobacter sp. MN05-02]|nr:hypothetical protein MN0502_21550 [Arthrobacter sp. MN05-02]